MLKLRFDGAGQERLGRRAFLTGLAVIGAGALAACSSGGSSSSGGSAAATPTGQAAAGGGQGAASGSTTTVKMTDDNKFDPASVTITKGSTIVWQNTSSAPHTVTFDPSKAVNKSDVELPSGAEPFDSGLIQPGQSFSHTFTVAGTYKYTCVPHETLGMHGTVIVQ